MIYFDERSTLMVFWINPAENTESPKLTKFISLNPIPMFGDEIKHICRLC
jgi:hypothetical protein